MKDLHSATYLKGLFLLGLIFVHVYAYAQNTSGTGKLVLIDNKGISKNVYLVDSTSKRNLTKFKNAHHIYDYQISPNSEFAFVHHMDFPPTKLSIYDLSKKTKIGDVEAIGGSRLQWVAGNRIMAIQGCGTSCSHLSLYNTNGKMVFAGPRNGECGFITDNPTQKYVADIPQYKDCADFIEITRLRDSKSYLDNSKRLYMSFPDYPEWISDTKLYVKYKVPGDSAEYEMTLDLEKIDDDMYK